MRLVGAVLASLFVASVAGGAVAAPAPKNARPPIAVTLPAPDQEVAIEAIRVPPASCAAKLPRATKDRADGDPEAALVHVVYLVASDFPDEGLDTNGTIDCSMRAQNQWFAQVSGGSEWRLDTFRTTVKKRGLKKKIDAVDVTFIQSDKKGSELYGADLVAAELQTRGLAEMNKRYLTYVAAGDDDGPCGDAFLDSLDPMPSGDDGQFAQIYMFSAEGCHAHEFGKPGKPSFVEAIGQQELMHNDGAVALGSPHFCTPGFFHVCTGPLSLQATLDPERFDVMFPYVTVPLSEKSLDIGNDDYFEHPFPFKDVADSRYLQKI